MVGLNSAGRSRQSMMASRMLAVAKFDIRVHFYGIPSSASTKYGAQLRDSGIQRRSRNNLPLGLRMYETF